MSYTTKNANSNTSYDQRIFSIDSKKRSDSLGSIADFRTSTFLPRDHDFDRLTCLQVNLPKAWYMLDTDATFQLNEATGAVDTTVTIAGGRNYTSAEMETALAAALTAASATGANIFTYTVAFSAASGKFTITASSGDFTLTFNSTSDPNKSIAKYLGFTEGAVSSSSASSILISANIVNFQRYDVLYVRSDMASNGGDDLLCSIYIGRTIDLAYVQWETPDAKYFSVGLADNVSSCSRFSLTDGDNKLVPMNGVNWQLTLQAFKSDRNFN